MVSIASTVTRGYSGCIGDTPMLPIALQIAGRWRTIHLKLESFNPTGSSKDRTARALITDLSQRQLLRPSAVVIESTSGNLGVALSFLCQRMGYSFLAVIDPKATPENRAKLQQFGAHIEVVEEADETGGYLLSRLERVRELCATSPNYVWTDQYSNPANPSAHYGTTGPEIYRQMRGRVEAVFVAISTGGTYAGVNKYFKEVSRLTRVIGVDARGSVVFGGSPGKRFLTGIGSSCPSRFIELGREGEHLTVSDEDAFAVCRQLKHNLQISVGGSSGATIFGCIQYLTEHPEIGNAVCICPDGATNYMSTIFTDDWLLSNGFKPDRRMDFVDGMRTIPG
jgi:N-(2-amino-2-carboxyethyl)-L-glutamate synthase